MQLRNIPKSKYWLLDKRTYCRGDNIEQNTAEVADEEIEHSKHFDEEAGFGHSDQKEIGGSSKCGDVASSSAVQREGTTSKEIRNWRKEEILSFLHIFSS